MRVGRLGRAIWMAAALVAAAMVVTACGASPGATASPAGLTAAPASPEPSPSVTDSLGPSDASAAPIVPDSPVAGIIVAVDATGLTDVKGFTLRTNDGETIEFTLGTLENADEFAPGHLKEHQATAAPILVFFNQTNGQLVVYRLEDAG